MKGWQNYKFICQRVKCDDRQLEQINILENNPYLVDKQQEDEFILHKIPYNECISLNDLMDAIKSNYVVIFKGQVILIIQAIIQHLFKMAEKKLNHSQLNANNIFIQLKPESNKFTTYQSIIQIDKIYFVQYLIVSNPQNQELSFTQDGKDIKKIIIKFLEVYQDNNFTKIIEEIKNIRDINDLKQFKQLNDLLDLFINEHIDINNQIMKANELENYNKINKQRYLCEKELLIYLEEVLKHKIKFEDNVCIENGSQMQEQSDNLEGLEYLQQYILFHFQPNFVKQFQNYYGDKLQNTYLIRGITKQSYNEFLTQIEPDRIRANASFDSVMKMIKNCFSSQDQIKQEILKDYKFDVEDLSKKEIVELLYKFYIKHSLGYDLAKLEQFEEVNSKVLNDIQQHLQEHYDMGRTYKILELINELI
ncbi:unnamed protein product (macronuclear) [Paramecium tetraurelia]|uniref:Protein kinase domain-containing protein n=1 Tax=Paramecium tetraurelia TaxID=5888 RepID=A0C730_PARTE|nr:uncharacterized protein GSPATT00035727001 [Paramecium tetraurelia]CAK66597.1 unnamed protein product [Paramecium tetraurelia]|eukprot:XP_001433994.1 hypothetical protein (macronuclear) [Paramecium tetraurelia strain d4-2]